MRVSLLGNEDLTRVTQLTLLLPFFKTRQTIGPHVLLVCLMRHRCLTIKYDTESDIDVGVLFEL